jgi:hypothetical protein
VLQLVLCYHKDKALEQSSCFQFLLTKEWIVPKLHQVHHFWWKAFVLLQLRLKVTFHMHLVFLLDIFREIEIHKLTPSSKLVSVTSYACSIFLHPFIKIKYNSLLPLKLN